MSNQNGVTAPQQELPPQAPLEAAEEVDSPRMEAHTLDYWREMTERQVERLRARVRQLEDEAAPLRQQIAALVQALRSTGGVPEHRQPGRRPGGPPRESSQNVLSAADLTQIRSLVEQGKTPAEIRESLPHLPSKSVYNYAYSYKHRLKKQGGGQVTTRREEQGRKLKDYRKATRMPQWVLSELLQLEQAVVADYEAGREVSGPVEEQIKGYLATAPRPRRLQSVGEAHGAGKNVYLTAKLLMWAEKTNMSTEGLEAVKALKAAYDVAKRDMGLASIPLVQLEVENALTLATRGRYRAMTRPTRELRDHG